MSLFVQKGLTPARAVFRASRLGMMAGRNTLAARLSPAATQLAPFHSSKKQQILPPLPQSIEGNVNDPVKVPTPSPTHGSYHWTFERLIAGSIVPLMMVPFVGSSVNPLLDGALGALIIVHCHMGFQGCIVDYFPVLRTPKTFKFLSWLLKGFTGVVLYAFYELETNDVGLTEGVRRVWKA